MRTPTLPEQLIGNLLHEEHTSNYDDRNLQYANELERSYSAPPMMHQGGYYGQDAFFVEPQRDMYRAPVFGEYEYYNAPFPQRQPMGGYPEWGMPTVPMHHPYQTRGFPGDEDVFRGNGKKGGSQERKFSEEQQGFSSGFDAWGEKRQEPNEMFYPQPMHARPINPMHYPEDNLMQRMSMMSLNGSTPQYAPMSPPPKFVPKQHVHASADRGRLYHSGDWYQADFQSEYSQKPMSKNSKVIGSGNGRQDSRGPVNNYFPVMSSIYTEDKDNEYDEEYSEGYSPQQSRYSSNSVSRTSSLLEQFRSSKNSNLELRDIVGHFMEFSCDQHGSRFIQQKLEIANEEKELVFEEIFPEALRLMTDVFGNYVIQKFFEYGSPSQKRKLGTALQGNVLELSLQMYGCRVVQKALEVIDPELQIMLIRELEGHVLTCIKDQNGNHVIQKVIEHVAPEHTNFIVNTFINKVFKLATHPYGCRVIQRILEQPGINEVSPASPTRQIVSELLHCTISLVQDQYGNYVVQHVLKFGLKEDKHEIISQLRGKIVQFSQHKFASNVIEQCVEYGTLEHCQWIIDEIISEPRALEVMMKHQYANYVVQKTLEVCSSQQREVLVEHIRPHIASLKKYTYGKHIIARMEKIQYSPY